MPTDACFGVQFRGYERGAQQTVQGFQPPIHEKEKDMCTKPYHVIFVLNMFTFDHFSEASHDTSLARAFYHVF